MNNKHSLKERLSYWFDKRMSKGTISMIKVLALFSIAVVILMTVIITAFGMSEEGVFVTFWDSLATLINAWMPSSGDGGTGYIIFTAITAVFGLLVTSVLIGIFSTAMEERLSLLRKGNSKVLETGHTVILGFVQGEYELLRQLISAANGEKRCIVIAGETERDTMDDLIRENLDIPKNIRILCRCADIGDPAALACCSLPDSEVIIINSVGDELTIRAMLAADKVLSAAGNTTTEIIGTVSSDDYQLPRGLNNKRMIISVQTADLIARVLARSCTQPGLSYAFDELFNYTGSELYLSDFAEGNGKTFAALTQCTDGGVPAGIVRNGKNLFCVPPDEVFTENDKLIFFGKDANSLKLTDTHELTPEEIPVFTHGLKTKAGGKKLVVIGAGDSADTVLSELSGDIEVIRFAGIPREKFEAIKNMACEATKARLEFRETASLRGKELAELVEDASYVVILNDGETDADTYDTKTMALLLRLRQIRKLKGLSFSVTTELNMEKSRELVLTNDLTDFVIASDMAAMLVAQIADKPELCDAIKELISKNGADMCLKKASDYVTEAKEFTVQKLRAAMLLRGCVLLGIINGENDISVKMDPALNDVITLSPSDRLICIGEADT